MDKEIIALARYYLDADLLESRETALPLADDELAKLQDDIEELAQVIDWAAEAWFEQRRVQERLAIRRARVLDK